MILTPKIIREKLEIEFDLDLSQKKRSREVVYRRHLAFKLCREFTTYSLSEIGEEFKKDHSTVIYSLKEFDVHKDQYYFKDYKKVYDRYHENFSKLTNKVKDFKFLDEISEIEEIKNAFFEEKNRIESELNRKYQYEIIQLQKKIDKYEKYSFFRKIVELPEDDFQEIKTRINSFFIMNGMNVERRKKRLLKKQLEC